VKVAPVKGDRVLSPVTLEQRLASGGPGASQEHAYSLKEVRRRGLGLYLVKSCDSQRPITVKTGCGDARPGTRIT
jgi:hypothetical protein